MRNTTFDIDRVSRPTTGGLYEMTRHATSRMYQRGLSLDKVSKVMEYGSPVYDRGALTFRVGKKTIDKLKPHGIDVSELEGVHVVTVGDGTIVSVYRNRQFRRPRKTYRIQKPACDRYSVSNHTGVNLTSEEALIQA